MNPAHGSARPFLLHHLLDASTEAHGSRTAVVDQERSLTYEQLTARANQLANCLRRCGVQAGDRVGLYLDKSLESVVGVYGILKAGAAYVPLDPQAPPPRLAYIAGNCGIQTLLTGAEKADSWPLLARSDDGGPGAFRDVVVLNGATPSGGDGAGQVLGPDDLDREAKSAAEARVIDSDLAYILYTSGSTGMPKGVMLSHRNALAFVEWAAAEYQLDPSDRVSNHAPLHFDLSVFDLYAAALAGAALVLVPQGTSVFPIKVAQFIARNEITVWYSVPSILSMMTLRGGLEAGAFPALRTILFAGEVFPTKYLRRLMRLLPHVRFANLYGPTETNVCTYYNVPALDDDDNEPIPIGRPIANDETLVFDENHALVEPGEVGELWVRGATVMHGYWGDEERTARTLVANPLGKGPSDRLYRTGDLVQLLDSGDYKFLGRRDTQIKSRGYRIELGEVETALYAHPGVVECAVLAVPDELVTNRIMAHVVVRDGIRREDLIGFCADRIPRYMVPEHFEFRSELPKTSTGKVDRQALQRETVAG